MVRPLALRQSDKIRNAHRLADIKEAQRSMDEIEGDVRRALTEALKKHGLKARDFSITLNLSAGDRGPFFGGQKPPAGYLSASLDVE